MDKFLHLDNSDLLVGEREGGEGGREGGREGRGGEEGGRPVYSTSTAPCTLHPLQSEAIPESLKNMLLVMSTQGVLDVSINSSQSDVSTTPNKVSPLELTM